MENNQSHVFFTKIFMSICYFNMFFLFWSPHSLEKKKEKKEPPSIMLKILVIGSNLPNVLASAPLWKYHRSFGHGKLRNATVYRPLSVLVEKEGPISSGFVCHSNSWKDEENDKFVKDLRVPDEWMTPSTALQESEWLRIALHKWLDDEYCPEIANEEISKRCSRVYYHCLMEKQADIVFIYKNGGGGERFCTLISRFISI
ncbi:uncharacterized protein LOC131077049 isoform X2 [Cryptomeria japonica]|uniref:uncharacterized protein LOC131077049 isoform X2 n=1 Tax=Cryptomeria japonica TaxID=3369 RepID=UPI0027DA88E4|nr:uncharacterized protein LOC131077049 isoform X2 [Cryptomeria japonica]